MLIEKSFPKFNSDSVKKQDHHLSIYNMNIVKN